MYHPSMSWTWRFVNPRKTKSPSGKQALGWHCLSRVSKPSCPTHTWVINVLLHRISTNAQVTMALQLEQMKLLCLSHTCIIFLQPTVKNTSFERFKFLINAISLQIVPETFNRSWNCSLSVLRVFFNEQTLHFFFRLPNVLARCHVFFYFLKIVREIIQIITRLQMGIPSVVLSHAVDITVASMGHNGSERGT